MTVWQTDQWSASDVERQQIKIPSADVFEIRGQSADAVREIFGGGKLKAKAINQIQDHDGPSLGYVWFLPDEHGVLKLYKSNYDTSD